MPRRKQGAPRQAVRSSSRLAGATGAQNGGEGATPADAARESRKALLLELMRARSAERKATKAKAAPGDATAVMDGGWYFCKALKGRRDYMEDTFHADVVERLRGMGVGSGSPLPARARGAELPPEGTHRSFFGVFDGHGGDVCSRFCREALLDVIRAAADDGVHEALCGGFTGIDDIVCEVSREMDDNFQDGTTATVAVLEHGRQLWVAHVGDSRCVLVRQDGSAEPLTRDHSCALQDECERIHAQGGQVLQCGEISRVMGVLAITRAIGDAMLKPYVTALPEVRHVVLDDADKSPPAFLCIATDGVWDEVSNEDAARLVLEHGVRKATLEATRLALERGSEDNLTFMAIDLNAGLPTAPSAAAAADRAVATLSPQQQPEQAPPAVPSGDASAEANANAAEDPTHAETSRDPPQTTPVKRRKR